MLYAILFVGAVGVDPDMMTPMLAVGPLDSLKSCAVIGALALDEMNYAHPEKDFRIDCSPSPLVARRPDAKLYDVHALAKIALDILKQEEIPGER